MNVSGNVSERALREIYLRGFERCVREGRAKGIMTSYNRINKVYAHKRFDLCTKLLRNDWDFDVVVMSDWFCTKGKGAGMLRNPVELDNFLGEVFRLWDLDMKVSVKTRVGIAEESEFDDVLEVLNTYSIDSVILHPRVQKDFH